MRKAILYIHGKGGNKDEANRYKKYLKDIDVFGLDYKGNTPWDTKEEIIKEYQRLKDSYDEVYILANSIGAYFVMNALSGIYVSKALFISPIVDMERLIMDMMFFENITEEELKEKKEIPTKFNETLSYEYLRYVRENPVVWKNKTYILYARKDNMTSFETVCKFVKNHDCSLTVMEDGEHWFHTKEQLDFLDQWLMKELM